MKLAEIEQRESEIYTQLAAIIQLKRQIDERITNGIKPISIIIDGITTTLSQQVIKHRIEIMAQEIVEDVSPDEYPLVISILNGAFKCGDEINDALINAGLFFQPDTIQVKSYSKTNSTPFKITMLPKNLWAKRNVWIVDDVSDSGQTFHQLKEFFLKGPVKPIVSDVSLWLIKHKREPNGPMEILITSVSR